MVEGFERWREVEREGLKGGEEEEEKDGEEARERGAGHGDRTRGDCERGVAAGGGRRSADGVATQK